MDGYVLATGADPKATQALAGIHIPQRTTPGVIAITKPMAPTINRIIVAPGVHIHQRGDGRIVLGEQDGPPKTQAHMARLAGRPTRFPTDDLALQHASRLISSAETFVPGMKSAKIEDVIIGWRPRPIDDHPVIGRSPTNPAAYLAIMHSGVSLAPIVGALAAKEVLSGQTAQGLEHYRPDRTSASVRRY
ncbi:MAG: FAD-dependent oxidoreductase [Pseudomonadota bacterium]